MLGIHDHTKNKHTTIEVLATFLVVLLTALNANFILTGALPSITCVYGNLLAASLATGAMYGINATRAAITHKKEDEAKSKEAT